MFLRVCLSAARHVSRLDPSQIAHHNTYTPPGRKLFTTTLRPGGIPRELSPHLCDTADHLPSPPQNVPDSTYHGAQ